MVLMVGAGFAFGSGPAPSALSTSRCGVSQVQHIARVGWVVVGAGPVRLGLFQTRRAEISIAQSEPDRKGWRGQKTPWYVPKIYRGSVTVTARRIDRPGQVRFAFGYGQHLRKLAFTRDNVHPPVAGFYLLPSAALFRSTGCYAFNVSGRRFSERLVVRVVA